MSRGWCIGGDKFRQEIREEGAAKGAFLELGRFAGLEPDEFETERRAIGEERLQILARESKIDLGKLPLTKSADEKVLLAAAMKKSCSVSNGWLAERLKMGQAASVNQFARCWQMQPKKLEKSRLFCQESRHDPFRSDASDRIWDFPKGRACRLNSRLAEATGRDMRTAR